MKRENLFLLVEDDDGTIKHKEFILRRESEALRAKRRELDERLFSAIMKSVWNAYVVLTCVFGCLGIVFAGIAVTNYLDSKPFPAVWVGLSIVSFILVGIFSALKKGKDKKSESEGEMDTIDREYERLAEASRAELWVPIDAKTVDVFVTTSETQASDEPYGIAEVLLFEESGNLCIDYFGDVIAVPIKSFEAAAKLDGEVSFDNWQKDEPYDGVEYAEYQIVKRTTKDDDEIYSMPSCYSLRFGGDEGNFEILVPLYEIKAFLEVLKLEVAEE